MKNCVQFLLIVTLPVLTLTAADQGFIKARGKPGDAGIFVDGKYIGPASRFTVPEKYSVDAGSHDVAIRDPRYEEFSAKITVTPGQDYQDQLPSKASTGTKRAIWQIAAGWR